MLLTPHVVISLLISKEISNPYIASISAFFSHYLLDIIPHESIEDIQYPIPKPGEKSPMLSKDKKKFWILAPIDAVFASGIFLFYIFFHLHLNTFNRIIPYFIIVLFGIIPDIFNIIGIFSPNVFFHFFAGIHHKAHLIFKISVNSNISIILQYIFSLLVYFFILQ